MASCCHLGSSRSFFACGFVSNGHVVLGASRVAGAHRSCGSPVAGTQQAQGGKMVTLGDSFSPGAGFLKSAKDYKGGDCLEDYKTIDDGLTAPASSRLDLHPSAGPEQRRCRLGRRLGRRDDRPHQQRCGDCEEQVSVSGHRIR